MRFGLGLGLGGNEQAAAVVAPAIDYGTPDPATVGVAYSLTPTLTGSGVTVTLESGSLPDGLSLNSSTGAITGTPTATFTGTLVVRATNSAGYAEDTFDLDVVAAPTLNDALRGITTFGPIWSTDDPATLSKTGDDLDAWLEANGSADYGIGFVSGTKVLVGTQDGDPVIDCSASGGAVYYTGSSGNILAACPDGIITQYLAGYFDYDGGLLRLTRVGNVANNGFVFDLQKNGSGGNMNFQAYAYDDVGTIITPVGPIKAPGWHLLCLIADGSTVDLFVNDMSTPVDSDASRPILVDSAFRFRIPQNVGHHKLAVCAFANAAHDQTTREAVAAAIKAKFTSLP